jgi:hypothetical protein
MREHPPGDRDRGRRHGGRETTPGERHNLSVEVGRKHRARSRFEPLDGARNNQLTNLRGVESVVGGTEHRKNGLRAAETSFQGALALSKAGSEIGP